MFTTIVIQPLYNLLIFLVNLLPNHDLWIALVVMTILLKTILIPLFKKQVRDQLVMQHLSPKLKEIQEKFKDKRDLLAKETMALYGKYKVNPFVSILILIIQLPFLIGLYQIFFYEISSYQNLLYAGLSMPSPINNYFLGVNLSQTNILFAVVAGLSQYVLGVFMFKKKTKEEEANEPEIMKAMNMQMKYFLPLVIGGVSVVTPSVIALYLIVTNLFGIGQEIIIKKPLEKQIKIELSTDN